MSQGARVPEELPFDQYQRYRLVTDVVAFGVEDELLGQAVHAAVSWAGQDATADLMRHCQQNMPTYMVPRQVHAWDHTMPRTSSGKIKSC